MLNITSLEILNVNNVQIEASNLSLSDGRGFYTTLTLEGEVTFATKDGVLSMNIHVLNGKTIRINNIKKVTSRK